MKLQRGFTLIELLVVIAIIGLLSSVVMASLNSARNKALDAKRQSDMQAVKNALLLYANDHDGMYPHLDAEGLPSIPSGEGYGLNCWNGWQSGNINGGFNWLEVLETGGYISKMPYERNMGNECVYRYVNIQTGGNSTTPNTECGSPTGKYAILAWKETTDVKPDSTYAQPACWASLNWSEGTAANPKTRIMILPQ